MEYNIKNIVKDNLVLFKEYRNGIMYYEVNFRKDTTSNIMIQATFPVPLDDIGISTLKGVDKAIFFMRWIRKAIEDNTFISFEYKQNVE
jgi:hypothetical protein